MLVPDRRRRLLEQVRQDGSATIDQLASALGVSRATVRRDLALLEDEGSLLRARGGAYIRQASDRYAVAPAPAPDSDAKLRIGHEAARHVEDGMTVMILAGSTTAAMLPHLAHQPLTVVTNGLDVAQALAPFPNISLVMLGGVLHREQMTFLGPMAEQSMANLHVDAMFAGAYGVHPEVGVTGTKVSQAGNHHVMLKHTESLVVLADGAKFGRQGPSLLAHVDQVDRFITDTAAPEAVVAELRELGADVTVC